MAYKFNADEIADLMRQSRLRTRELFSLVREESDLRRPPADGFRPLLWHLGHVGAFEDYWILQRVKGDPTISPRYDRIFDPIKTPKEDSNNLPPIPEIESYLAHVREEVLGFLASGRASDSDPMLRDGYVFNMVIEHEYQHQETLCYLLQMLDPQLKRKPDNRNDESGSSNSSLSEMVSISGGPFEMGSGGYPFAYDNEQPPHRVVLTDFRIDRYPVTNAAYAEFIETGGYSTRSLWSDDGWAWKEKNNIEHPLYWSRAEGRGWRVQEMFEEVDLKLDHPVIGVSWHEACAYARWAGKRLPTEAEWEKAASWDAEREKKRRFSWGDDERADVANYDFNNWGTTGIAAHPSGASAYGSIDMTGNVWEWTATTFAGYPGFAAYPYPEYSEIWFDGDHRILKGGSWATQLPLLRCSFRNFWRPQFRIAFAGFRCAAD
ncbi:MAG TPA: ergothioneine biosynthesis protein EgtB [Blastocatellia bacterium]|nr:ergothioneine biosynthesis protein EgtB [Blastocatellia bacterium]